MLLQTRVVSPEDQGFASAAGQLVIRVNAPGDEDVLWESTLKRKRLPS